MKHACSGKGGRRCQEDLRGVPSNSSSGGEAPVPSGGGVSRRFVFFREEKREGCLEEVSRVRGVNAGELVDLYVLKKTKRR